jgi:hypothetical protein
VSVEWIVVVNFSFHELSDYHSSFAIDRSSSLLSVRKSRVIVHNVERNLTELSALTLEDTTMHNHANYRRLLLLRCDEWMGLTTRLRHRLFQITIANIKDSINYIPTLYNNATLADKGRRFGSTRALPCSSFYHIRLGLSFGRSCCGSSRTTLRRHYVTPVL